jgi:hypothetical protein
VAAKHPQKKKDHSDFGGKASAKESDTMNTILTSAGTWGTAASQ